MALRYIKLYYDWREATRELSKEEKGNLIDAMIAYASGEEFSVSGNERFVFPVFQSQIDRDMESYAAIADRNQKNGSKGGRPRKTQENPENPLGYLGTQKSQDKDKDKDKDKDDIRGAGETPAPKRKRFTPPTVEEVREYIREKGYSVDPERFVDHYTSNGWKVGKNPMKDWRATVRNWNRKEAPAQGRGPIANYGDSADISNVYD